MRSMIFISLLVFASSVLADPSYESTLKCSSPHIGFEVSYTVSETGFAFQDRGSVTINNEKTEARVLTNNLKANEDVGPTQFTIEAGHDNRSVRVVSKKPITDLAPKEKVQVQAFDRSGKSIGIEIATCE